MSLRTKLIDAHSKEDLGTYVLPCDPFPGDNVRVGDVRLLVIRRTIVAYEGDDPWESRNDIDLELTVREA